MNKRGTKIPECLTASDLGFELIQKFNAVTPPAGVMTTETTWDKWTEIAKTTFKSPPSEAMVDQYQQDLRDLIGLGNHRWAPESGKSTIRKESECGISVKAIVNNPLQSNGKETTNEMQIDTSILDLNKSLTDTTEEKNALGQCGTRTPNPIAEQETKSNLSGKSQSVA